MKIKMELRPGDIVLLKVLSCVLILFVFFNFLVIPAGRRHQELAAELEQEEALAQEMQAAIDAVPVLSSQIEQQKATLAERSKPYYERLDNSQVDGEVTGLAMKHGLFPVSLSIGETLPEVPSVYPYGSIDGVQGSLPGEGPSASELALEKEMDLGEDAPEEEEAPIEETDYVYQTEAEMVLRGSEEQLRAMLDDIARNYPSISVDSLRMSDETYLNENLEQVHQMHINCVLTLYTCYRETDKGGEGVADES